MADYPVLQDNSFKSVPSSSSFVQTLHIAECHWVVVANVNPKSGGFVAMAVHYYDSNCSLRVSDKVRDTICSFFKCDASS